MAKTQLHKLTDKYPRIDVIRKKWVKKTWCSEENGWHWGLTKAGEQALKRKVKRVV